LQEFPIRPFKEYATKYSCVREAGSDFWPDVYGASNVYHRLRHQFFFESPSESKVLESTDAEVELPISPPTQTMAIVSEMHACGPRANFHTYNLSDGSRISTSCRGVSSPARARHEVQKMLRGAQILERHPQYDERGRIVGEQILARADQVISVEINRSAICSTEASSLKQLQWFEHR